MGIRKLLAGVGAAGVALMLGASAAWACTNLATLNLSNAAGQAGQSVAITGSSFATSSSFASLSHGATPVVLHWNGVNGPVLATATPDSTGSISATVTVPHGQPGYYVIVATQSVHGTPAYGTPARAAFEILAPGQHAAITPNAAQTAGVASASPSSTGVIALTVVLGVAGLALFGAGAGAFVRQARRRSSPATQSVKKG